MAKSYSRETWTEQDDYYLISQQGTITHAMMAEDLGRGLIAVRNRIRFLRRKGIKIASIPTGRPKAGAFAPATDTVELVTGPQLPIDAERQVLKEEIAKYLAQEVNANRLDADQVRTLIGKLKSNVLQAPEDELRRYLVMPVARIVEEVA